MAATSLTALRLDRRRVRAENERLRRQEDREQRKERGAAYYRTVILLNRLDRFAAGDRLDEDTLSATIDDYNRVGQRSEAVRRPDTPRCPARPAAPHARGRRLDGKPISTR
jgi:hypothetical protein